MAAADQLWGSNMPRPSRTPAVQNMRSSNLPSGPSLLNAGFFAFLDAAVAMVVEKQQCVCWCWERVRSTEIEDCEQRGTGVAAFLLSLVRVIANESSFVRGSAALHWSFFCLWIVGPWLQLSSAPRFLVFRAD